MLTLGGNPTSAVLVLPQPLTYPQAEDTRVVPAHPQPRVDKAAHLRTSALIPSAAYRLRVFHVFALLGVVLMFETAPSLVLKCCLAFLRQEAATCPTEETRVRWALFRRGWWHAGPRVSVSEPVVSVT